MGMSCDISWPPGLQSLTDPSLMAFLPKKHDPYRPPLQCPNLLVRRPAALRTQAPSRLYRSFRGRGLDAIQSACAPPSPPRPGQGLKSRGAGRWLGRDGPCEGSFGTAPWEGREESCWVSRELRVCKAKARRASELLTSDARWGN